MCGIVGSSSRESGFDLYLQNLTRGYYSSSVTVVYEHGHVIIKKSGDITLNDIPLNGKYYLFHSRGPTVETLKFEWDDNHPFSYGRYIVAHNGIIENANQLYGGDIGVDSRVVPYLLDKEYRDKKTPNIIGEVISKLEGTFGLWIYDTNTKDLYIARHDITLFNYGSEFSSSNPGYMNEVPQDTIFKINTVLGTIEKLDSFKLKKKPKFFVAPSD